MRRRLSIRARVALWCAALAIVTGALGVAVTLRFTNQGLREAARATPAVPVSLPLPPGVRPAGAAGGPGAPRATRADLGPAGPAGPGVLATPAGRIAEGVRVQGVLDRSGRRGLLTVLSIAALSVMASWLAARRMLRPVGAMTATARRVSVPGSGERIRMDGPGDELDELAHTIDGMLDRLDHAFDAQRRFVADASHELRTPLAVLTTEVDVALDDVHADAPALRASLLRVHDELGRTRRLVESLLHLSRADTLAVREPHDLAESAEQAVGVVPRLGLGARRVKTSLQSAPVAGDPVLLDRLVLNLVENAVRYNDEGGLVRVATSSDHDDAVLVVENDGPVVDPAEAPQLFERFRRGGTNPKAADPPHLRGDGHGLGLAIARAVVVTHGGTITLTPRAEGGLRVDVRIPRGGASSAS